MKGAHLMGEGPSTLREIQHSLLFFEHRSISGLPFILTVLGLFDLALGAAIAAFGPGFIGDPSLDTVIRICGAVFALAGHYTRKRTPQRAGGVHPVQAGMAVA